MQPGYRARLCTQWPESGAAESARCESSTPSKTLLSGQSKPEDRRLARQLLDNRFGTWTVLGLRGSLKGRSICITIFGIAMSALHMSIQAQSFDCAKASSAVERAICSDNDLRSLDAKLGITFKRAVLAAGDHTRSVHHHNLLRWYDRRNPYCLGATTAVLPATTFAFGLS